MKKNIMTSLVVREFRENAGTKITRMGKKRKFIVRQILGDAMNRHSTIENTARLLKEKANTPKRKDKRDWIQIVTTEYTTAKAVASIDILRELFGDDHSVYRESDPNCCKECHKLFGIAPRYKKYRIGDVTLAMSGAVHPNCICGIWRSVSTPDLVKAMDPLADIPMGVVKRMPDGVGFRAEISTGTGYWVNMDSVTGRSIMRVILSHTPAIFVGSANGFSILAHGCHRTKKPYKMYDFSRLGAGRFYPYDLSNRPAGEMREKGMTMICDMQQYMEKIRAALPVVACMPNYWDNGEKWHYLTDFMGYKTLTDWIIAYPGDLPDNALIAEINPKLTSQRRAVRSHTQRSMDGDSLMKAQKSFKAADALRMIRSGKHDIPHDEAAREILKDLKKIAPMGWELKTVKLSEINRRDPKKWENYSGKIKKYEKVDPEEMPPIVLTAKGYSHGRYYGDMLPGASKDKHSVIDGHHRQEAAIKLGEKTIKAWVPIEDEK